MSMQQLVEKYADAPSAEVETKAPRSSRYEPAGEHVERAKIDGLVSVTIQAETAGDGTLGNAQVTVADVGGKFLLDSMCRAWHYQANQLGKLIDGQRTSLDKMINSDRSDEEHDDRIASLTLALQRNEDNFSQYVAALEQAAALYLAFTGDKWMPPAGRADREARLQTAARAEAAEVLKRLAEKRPIRKGAVAPASFGRKAEERPSVLGRLGRLFK